ncbi:hypothetical protein E2I00_004096 [Balaenoptera physalus]|uniref:HTH psq-type domain-containing protein n=1 Tax=Balaenoptera physalus TaxID=9770 RepID=A0A643C0U9_BALPH|nr:hypothetical protein E2I00_004096 [Balaenoptera physalus]
MPQNCDPNIPLVAQELMKKMIRQFAIEYISKSGKIQENRNGSIGPSLICKSIQMNQAENSLQEEQEGPLDLTVNRMQEQNTQQGDGVLDLSTKKTSIKSEESSICDPSSENSVAGRLHRNREDYVERSAEFADGLLSKALKDIQSGALDINKAGILYGIPQKTLLLHLEALPAGKPASFKNKTRDFNDSYSYKDSKETCAVLQKVALWARAQAERTEKSKLNLLETSELKFPTASSYLHQLTLQKMVTQFKEKNESLQYETHPTVQLKIPQLRVSSVSKPQPDGPGLLDVMYQVSKTSPVLEGSALQKLKNILPKQNKIECSGPVTHSSVDSYFLHGDLSPLCLNSKNGTVDGTSENTEDGLDRKDNKQPRKKRGRYRQYDHEIMEEAIAMVMSGKMSVSKAQGIYGVPHSTLEYKTEGFEKLKDVISELSALENNILETNINQPPSLTPAEISSDKDDHEGKMHKTKKSSNSDCLLLEDSNNCTTNQEEGETTVIFQDLMDRINEKLKSIETIDMTNLIKLSSSDCNRDNDLKLRDLITSLLHNAKASDYSFMELLSQHDKKVENKIIQTRFRKRQETLLAMRNSPDSPIFRRQSLQIKRELASLDENFIRKKYTEKNPRKFMCRDELFSADKEEFYHCQGPSLQNSKSLQDNHHAETFSPDYGLQSLQLPLNLETNLAFDAFSESFKTTSEKRSIRRSQEKSVAGKNFLQNHKENPKLENIQTPLKSDVPGLLSRTKRNIVPPGWYSIYVTNNYIFKKSPKAKKASDSTKKKDPVKNIQIESAHNIDLNKIAMNSNLQVVVERLEDTINMAKKSWNNQSLSEGYKASKKLIEIDGKDQHAGRNMTLTVSRMTCKEQSLSKSIVASPNIKSNHIPAIDLNNKRLDNQKKSSVLNTGSLISSVENVPTKYEPIESSSFANYSSPIKLMFLSEVKSSEGVKYTLTSVGNSESNRCLPSEKPPTHQVNEKKKETNENTPNANFENCSSNLNDSDGLQKELNKFNCAKETAESSAVFTDDMNSDKPQEEPKEYSSSAIDSSFKRKPGRPKKIGPQVVKQIKRPIGRPPKPKTDQTDITICQNQSFSAEKKSPESLISEVKEEYNSLRNIREYEIDSGERISAISSLTTETETLGSGFEYVRPIKNKSVIPQPSKNIIRPNQKSLAIIRKPGRPAKVKISGISVTINRISPQEREVSISSCLPPLEQENILEKNLPEVKYDHQYTVDTRHTEADEFKNGSKSMVATIPLRHSIRDRKPSLHFLHSLASSGSLIYRNALLHKSCKLHLQKELKLTLWIGLKKVHFVSFSCFVVYPQKRLNIYILSIQNSGFHSVVSE